jgi:hypothetical protein
MEMFRQVIDLLLHLDKSLACGVTPPQATISRPSAPPPFLAIVFWGVGGGVALPQEFIDPE